MTPTSRYAATERLEPNPAGGGLLVAGIVVAVAVGGFMLLSKKKEEPKPSVAGQMGPIPPGDLAPCPIDAVKLTTWATAKGLFAIYGATLATAPDFSTVVSAFKLDPKTTPETSVVVVTGTGGFYKYSEGKPVAAPDLRTSYCKFNTLPAPPAPITVARNAQSNLSGELLYSPTFL